MFDSNVQDDTGRGYNNQEGLGGNLVQESNILAEGEDQYQSNQIATQQNTNDNSFHVGELIEKMQNNPNFTQKENEISQKLDEIFKEKTGRPLSAFSGYVFLANKILLILTFTEFLFQRFDIVTLFLNIVIMLIELGIFNQKHMYKWLIVLIGSLLLDALVLLDISPVR
jgi:hypothetical protein